MLAQTVAPLLLCCPLRKTLAWRHVIDTTLVAAAGLTSTSEAKLSQRLTRHMVALAVPAPSEGVLRSICTSILGGFLSANFTPGERPLYQAAPCSVVHDR